MTGTEDFSTCTKSVYCGNKNIKQDIEVVVSSKPTQKSGFTAFF